MAELHFANAAERVELAVEAAHLIEAMVPLLVRAIDECDSFGARGLLLAVQEANNATLRLLNASGDDETEEDSAEALRQGRIVAFKQGMHA